jgi:DNA-binding CsgD family transcriptional regulator
MLTVRQREVATMAASGLSNRVIAERLGVSVRTVENFVYKACLIAGVNNRSQLAALFRNGHGGRRDRG